jgi:7,8-dihydropterin-6-yl-methyl-4-(beta-D-ribofuranosyl)aminobenzene 5'-phosphate synthase
MKLRKNLFVAASLAAAPILIAPTPVAAAEPAGQITILYDAFGADAAMKKDWGFSALVEISGKRILFDTGNDPDIFAANVKAKNIDLASIDFVVLSHRHSDHMAGLNHVLSVNPTVKIYAPKEGFGIYGSSLPSSFYRKDESLPAEMRYYGGKPPEVMKFGTAWPQANVELIDKTTEISPGITLLALVSDAPGTRELKELSLAVNTADGVVLVASDETIARTVAALKDTFKVENIAPGHCTGEPTFAALKRAYGDRYLYAGVGTSLPLGPGMGSVGRRGEGPALQQDDLATYRKLARREDPFGILKARSLLSGLSHL